MSDGLCYSLDCPSVHRNSLYQTPAVCSKRSLPYRKAIYRTATLNPNKGTQCIVQNNTDKVVFVEDPQRAFRLLGPRGTRVPSPVLLYIAGLDAEPLPENQCEKLREQYSVVSLCHKKEDRSDWECLVRAALETIKVLKENSSGVTLVGESFGAAFALRIAAASPPNMFDRLVLLNSGTALANQPFLSGLTNLLPILRIDRTERVLYKLAGIILFKGLLTREERLDDRNIPPGNPALRSISIQSIPIQTLCHRVKLLREFETTFPDSCMNLVTTPTSLIASQNDRLLNSTNEARRLGRLLPNVIGVITLENCEHAALWERDVNLSRLLASDEENVQGIRASSTHPAARVSSEDVRSVPVQVGEGYEYSEAIEEGRRVFEPWRKAICPKVVGKSNVEKALKVAQSGKGNRPVLFVGNHGMLGIMDTSLIYMEILDLLNGDRLRPLADQIHFGLYSRVSNGRWDNFIKTLGAVKASPLSFYRLLAAGDRILLFPGGAREVCRRRGERNQIFWDSELDFLRPAAKFNALIVPFSAVGADDAVNIVLDGQELQKLPVLGPGIRRFLKRNELSVANVMPLTTTPPRLDRFYFKFHEPIDTESIEPSDISTCREVYKRVKQDVENGISELVIERERDPQRTWQSRTMRTLLEQASKVPRPGDAFRSLLDIMPGFDL
ncbi:hypothetical protein FGB62_30g312 [Gracilaria domingensis]|nr:hypothetical protein FGB62_30g312 [Gracilaria domingensis]